MAGSCVLLIVAGLLVRALNHIASAHTGSVYEQMFSLDPGLAAHGYSPETARANLDTLQSRLRALPGVESVSLTSTPPLGRRTTVLRYNTDGRIIDTHMFRVDTAFSRAGGSRLEADGRLSSARDERSSSASHTPNASGPARIARQGFSTRPSP